ncbi:putative beta-1,3-N-acetylgalactosaminyltransferase 2 [Colletotrichum sp. SAR 10_98]|nr:putative beta-1,3-N-acetylgalactosaminyltransferase 2 [Colletotrichum sp. SAR 10_98]
MVADDGTDSNKEHAPWLAAVISTASDVERRMLIRSTWMRLYEDVSFDGRFVVSNPGPRWMEVVSRENNTFGDMIVLDHIQEDDVTANTIKTLEFYKWLVNKSPRYEFVSKMDTDLWLNARGFWDRFLQPRLSMNNESGRLESTINRTVIGELYYSKYWDLTFPHGAMYTVTWDMVELLSSLQEKFKVVTGEDMAVGTLMLKGRERANFINFKGSEKFDYDDRDARQDGSAWAGKHTHPNSINHALVEDDPIAVHQLKDEAYWFKVADCFDEDGVKSMPPQSKYETQRPMSMRWHDFWYSLDNVEADENVGSLTQVRRSRLVVVKIDATVEKDAHDAVAELQKDHGIDHLDIVIANAGVSSVWPSVADLKISDLQAHMEPNVYGVVSLFQATRPLLKKSSREPIFTLMGSTAGCLENQPPITNGAYGPSKAAANWFGIRINAEEDWLNAFILSPGWVQTDLGNAGARYFGLKEASIGVDESCDGMMEVLANTTKEKHGGKMVFYNGETSGY